MMTNGPEARLARLEERLAAHTDRGDTVLREISQTARQQAEAIIQTVSQFTRLEGRVTAIEERQIEHRDVLRQEIIPELQSLTRSIQALVAWRAYMLGMGASITFMAGSGLIAAVIALLKA